MGVKHHYQQHQLRNITASQFKRWRKQEYSNHLQTDTLYHMMYTVHFYTSENRTLARQHTFGYAGFIWYCQAPVIVCCVVNQNLPSLFIKGKRKTNYDIMFFSMSVNIICTCGNLCLQILILQGSVSRLYQYLLNEYHGQTSSNSYGTEYGIGFRFSA